MDLEEGGGATLLRLGQFGARRGAGCTPAEAQIAPRLDIGIAGERDHHLAAHVDAAIRIIAQPRFDHAIADEDDARAIERRRPDDARRCRDLDAGPQRLSLAAQRQVEPRGLARPAQQRDGLAISRIPRRSQPERREPFFEEGERDRLTRLGRPAPVKIVRAQRLHIGLDPRRRQDGCAGIGRRRRGGGQQQKGEPAGHAGSVTQPPATRKRYTPASRIVSIATKVEVLATCGSAEIRSPSTSR